MYTDYILAAVTFILAMRLWRLGRVSPRFWGGAFVLTAIAAVLAGTVHGVDSDPTGPPWRIIWQIMLLCVSIAGTLALCGAVCEAVESSRSRRWWIAGATIKLMVVAIWLSRHPDFAVAMRDYLVSVVVVLALMVYVRHTWGRAGAGEVMWGLVITLLAAGLRAAAVSPGRHFDENDLYHAVQVVGFVIVYRGVVRLNGSRVSSSDRSTLRTLVL